MSTLRERRPRAPRDVRISVAVAVVALGPSTGCAPPAKCPEVPAVERASATVPATPPSAPRPAATEPRLAISLTPDPRLPGVTVRVSALGAGTPLGVWSIAAPDAGTFTLDEAKDDAGPLKPSTVARGKALAVNFDRAPVGEVRLRYHVAGRSRPLSQPPGVDADPNRVLASGEALLLLPDALEERSVTTTLKIDATPLGESAAAGSTFGFGGERSFITRGSELRFATFAAGPIGHALFDTPEGRDEAVWLGYTTFDPRPIAADVASFRTAAREIFHERTAPPHTLLIASDARAPGLFIASRRADSVLVRVGVGESWTAPVRIAVAAEVLHAWIGGRVWVGPTDAAHEAEAYWFTEGVTRGFARDLLFRFGLVTPTELLEEMHGLSAVLASSPRAHATNATLAAHVHEPGVVPILVARGALYAARLDALVRKKSGGKRRFDDVLRSLYARARDARAALPISVFRDVVEAEVGPAEAAAFTASVENGGPIEVPEGALGPCFRGEPRSYQLFDLGFDVEATHAASNDVITGLRPGGPAERAGVRSGDRLVELTQVRGRADRPVTVVVEREGSTKKLQFLPAGPSGKGQGWLRRKEVSDDACAK